mmetsp:Transcript_22459/g.64570  ORF Transcript_22459/g.64570 Transcript_22459/m.64570 type:complete len:374 (+) Transcript_22459:927-2048(+)
MAHVEDMVLHTVGRMAHHRLDLHRGLRVLGRRNLHDDVVRRRHGMEHASLAFEQVLREDDHGPDDGVIRGHQMELDRPLRFIAFQRDVQLGIRWDDALAGLLTTRLELLHLLLVAVQFLRKLLLPGEKLSVHVALLGIRGRLPAAAAVLTAGGGRQPTSDLALGREAHQRAPAIETVIRVHQGGDRGLEVGFGEDLAGLFVPHLDLAILPTCDELWDAVVVEVEAVDAVHPVFGLHAPSPRHSVVHPDGPMHQRVSEALPMQRLDADDDVGLGDLLDHILALEDPHLEILGATNELHLPVVVDIAEAQRADVVACDLPEHLRALAVEGLDGAVPSNHTHGRGDVRNPAEGDDVHTIVDFLVEEVRVVLDIVDH